MSDEVTDAIPEVGDQVGGVVVGHDRSLDDLVAPDARLTRLVGGCVWTEGPVYVPSDGSVLFSDIPYDRAIRWWPDRGARIVRQPNGYTNGNTLDREGRVVHCEHLERRILAPSTTASGMGWSGTTRTAASTRPMTSSWRAMGRSGSPIRSMGC